jgi:hypothetical protein
MSFRSEPPPSRAVTSVVQMVGEERRDHSPCHSTRGLIRLRLPRLLIVVVLAAIAGGGGAPHLRHVFAATSPPVAAGADPAIADEAVQAEPVLRYVNRNDATWGGQSPCDGPI